MSDQSPYEKLELTEAASFEDIQEARNRLVKQYAGDRKQVEQIEAAYDAILMDRLRMRQEGKIKVPDRIRFPERLVQQEEPPSLVPAPPKQAPAWLQRFIDTPSRADVLLPTGLFAGLGVLSFFSPGLSLALGVGSSLYLINRKERKFGRAVLLTLGGLVLGIALGLQVASFLSVQLVALNLTSDTFASLVTFVVLWIISSFLR